MLIMDNKNRCDWCQKAPLYMDYHDNEWGIPLHDEVRLFEMLILEGAQAGLSWLTVLKKRVGYRLAYDGFDVIKVAAYDEHKIQSLLNDDGIIRNQLKVKASVTNAQAFIKIAETFNRFDHYIWGFVEGEPIINHWQSVNELPTHSVLSDKISQDLKRRGFSFVGTRIIYAYMQAIGMINDHLLSCWCRTDKSVF